MKPENPSLRLLAITRAKAKMFEFGVPESEHLSIPSSDDPTSLLLIAIAILGDVSAAADDPNADLSDYDIGFSATYFDALLNSRVAEDISVDVSIMAAAAYYLAGRPGSSLVVANEVAPELLTSPLAKFLQWVLSDVSRPLMRVEGLHSENVNRLADLLYRHYREGIDSQLAVQSARNLRDASYKARSPRDILHADVVLAVVLRKVRFSTWNNLPAMSDLSVESWRGVFSTNGFPLELWPSQYSIGEQNVFRGISAVIQMPTSAGKTRSLEMIFNAGFLSGRAKLAVVVAPFRALCKEITDSLRRAFESNQDVTVNILSDVIKDDVILLFEELFTNFLENTTKYNILILTPEKIQYVVRQHPVIMERIDILVYDEAHQFDTGQRGVLYELLLAELGSSVRESTQIIAISAVVKNSEVLRQWLLGGRGIVVDGSGLNPTSRATAFATWQEQRGQLQFFENGNLENPDYFVPRTINSEILDRQGRERAVRSFPDNRDSFVATDIALYLSIRLVSSGACAIFAGTKATASKLLKRAVEVFERGIGQDVPAYHSDEREIAKIVRLISLHFGENSIEAKAGRLGIFAHHGNTPGGLRLAIEYAMQQNLLRLVICTSTLAQGVNLPIRYLLVPSIYQGRREIRVRDFQNLLGRAGRAGMHTEGLVIFTDPRIYDTRGPNPLRFDRAQRLLDPENSEPLTSSLLLLIRDQEIPLWPLLDRVFLNEVSSDDLNDLQPEVANRLAEVRSLLSVIESYLMANHSTESADDLISDAESLVEQTFAFFVATEDEKTSLRYLFTRVAVNVWNLVPDSKDQKVFSSTLLGASNSRYLNAWVQETRDDLLGVSSIEELFELVWPVLTQVEINNQKALIGTLEDAKSLASAWYRGESYEDIFQIALNLDIKKRHGQGWRKVSENDILNFLHKTVAYDLSLLVSAIDQLLGEPGWNVIAELASSFKYGLREPLSVAFYEAGLEDRAIAAHIAELLRISGFEGSDLFTLTDEYINVVASYLENMPTYFSRTFDNMDFF
ncbi:DEAD/DEAH box helicase [Arthrobacter sp. LS16]|uniref:DEAD/DEAH box helicase n=1 Tax=Arthrobacter sp. 'calajunan' TaxID=1690248 RepID=UPI003C726C6F